MQLVPAMRCISASLSLEGVRTGDHGLILAARLIEPPDSVDAFFNSREKVEIVALGTDNQPWLKIRRVDWAITLCRVAPLNVGMVTSWW